MGQTIFKILILGISGAIASLAIFSCSQSKPDEPVARPVMPMEIDPDQKALPKEAPVGDALSNVLSSAPSNATVEPEAPLQAAASIPREGSSARPPKEVGSGPQVRYIKAAILNIRAEPNRYSKILGLLRGYDKVHVKINRDWAELEAGQWIRSRWLVKNPPKKIVGLSSEDDMAGPEIKKKKSRKTGKKKLKVIK